MPEDQAELIFGFVYGVGTNADPVVSLTNEYLKQFGYESPLFRVSDHLRTLNFGLSFDPTSTFEEMNTLMTAGDKAREYAKKNDILAIMAVNEIADRREDEQPLDRVAHLIRSLKTPDEVRLLREVYRPGFFLIGIACDDDEQRQYLKSVKGLTEDRCSIHQF